MQALIVVDAQNEFSPSGQRAVPNHGDALARILHHVADARREHRPIAFVQHHNKPDESAAFIPGSWGAELSPGLSPRPGYGQERLFEKDVFGAFTTTDLDPWLRDLDVTEVLIVGFYAHMCLSTSAREALVRGYAVTVDPLATGASDLKDDVLGALTADEVRRSALLHLTHMGVQMLAPVLQPNAPGELSMAKAYWVNTFRSISDQDRVVEYAQRAGRVMEALGGRFLARGQPSYAFEAGVLDRTVVIEFDNVEQAAAAYRSDGYQDALRALGDGAVRDIRIIEGVVGCSGNVSRD